jgi:hypothetical protein
MKMDRHYTDIENFKFDLLKKLLKHARPPRLYFEPSRLKRKKRPPLKEKWLRKWNQLGFYEKA